MSQKRHFHRQSQNSLCQTWVSVMIDLSEYTEGHQPVVTTTVHSMELQIVGLRSSVYGMVARAQGRHFW
jgi:hypothetical protein